MISVIVPYYCTKEEYFDKCMDSLLADKIANIEILVIDDGSPCKYHAITDQYLCDARVKVIHSLHKGVSAARNIGIEQATGEWITFVDSDDYLEPGSMNILLAATEQIDADLIYYNGYGDKGGTVKKNHFFLKEGVDYAKNPDDRNQVMASALSLGYLPKGYTHSFSLGGVCCKLINRRLIERCHARYNQEVHFAEDTIFSLLLIKNAESIRYIDAYLYHYFINNDSVTNKYRVGLSKDMDIFFEKALESISELETKEALNEAYYWRAYIEAQRCIRKEIYHKDNHMPVTEKKRIAKSFLKKEPYCTAFSMKNEHTTDKKYILICFLLKNGFIWTYSISYKIIKKISVLLTKK